MGWVKRSWEVAAGEGWFGRAPAWRWLCQQIQSFVLPTYREKPTLKSKAVTSRPRALGNWRAAVGGQAALPARPARGRTGLAAVVCHAIPAHVAGPDDLESLMQTALCKSAAPKRAAPAKARIEAAQASEPLLANPAGASTAR
jgi:hypothetical protein